jgi:hypothetical protein
MLSPARLRRPLGFALGREPGLLLRAALVWAAIAGGYLAAAPFVDAPPFGDDADPYGRSAVLNEVPPGFPLPDGAELVEAGRGEPLPYHAVWTSEQPPGEVAALYRALPALPDWDLMLEESAGEAYRLRLSRLTPEGGLMTHWLMVEVAPLAGGGSRIALDFMATQRIALLGDDG